MTVQPGPQPAPQGWSREQLEAAFAEADVAIGRFNLAVLGKTGVGKSTLVNAMFGEAVAATGIGQPVTRGSHLHVHRTGKLGIVDTQGLEVGRDAQLLVAEMRQLVESTRTLATHEQVHLVWYCVRASDRRLEPVEELLVRRLAELDLPVILVLTQVPGRHDSNGGLHVAPDVHVLVEHIRLRGLPIHGGGPLLVNAVPDPFTGAEQHGLLDLLDATFRLAPAQATDALVAAQRIDPGRKARAVEKVVKASTAAATAAGLTPIPFADAAVLVPIQVGMMARIAAIYDIPAQRATVASLATTTVTTQTGRFAATSLLKLIPGVGTLAGGAITGGVAGTITYAVGHAWHRVCIGMAAGRFTTVSGTLDSALVNRVFNQEMAAVLRRSDPVAGRRH